VIKRSNYRLWRANFVLRTASSCGRSAKNPKPSALFLCALEPPDLAIKIPDFHIADIRKLASGLQRVSVTIGVDWFVRGYPIVPID
jgi:hypothetical protein